MKLSKTYRLRSIPCDGVIEFNFLSHCVCHLNKKSRVNIIIRFFNQILQRLGKPEDQVLKSSLHAVSASTAFSKLTLQDKILIVGKLINRSESADGYKKRSMERALVALNRELNCKIIEAWRQIYSK